MTLDASMLMRAGVDYDAGIARFLGDKELYEEVLSAFLADDSLSKARCAFEKRQGDELLAVVHEVKGSSGNADMVDLFKASCDLVLLLRSRPFSDEDLREAFSSFEAAYETAREGIRTASRK